MKNWTSVLVSPETSILDTIKIIDQSSLQIALVVDSDWRLLGTVTDGDVRRGILRGIALTNSITRIMHEDPVVASIHDSPKDIQLLMRARGLRHIPIVDLQYRVVDLYIYDRLFDDHKKDNLVILMAGGLGTRLRPLTDHAPKPLLRVGDRPILETILLEFIEHQFANFYLSVNYKAEQIKDYFQDGSRWNVNIRYIDETKRLGTAGALSLLSEQPTKPIIIMNGDLLTKVNFEQLLTYHEQHGMSATMCVREIEQQIPYGVVKTKEHRLLGIEEKPLQHFFINAGIYVLNPEVLSLIPKDTFYDMPTLFDKLLEQGNEVSVFPVREYWMDIGRMSDYEKANGDFYEVFQ
jgi:dTDP-glucose pyrophosphorylase